MSRRLRQVWMVFANEGITGLVRRGLRRLWLRERYFIYLRRLDGDPPPVWAAESIMVRPASGAERADLARNGEGLGIARYGELLDPDADCYIAWDGDRIAGVCWVSTAHEPNGLVDLEPGDFLLGPAATIARDQGRGVYKMLMSFICAARQRQGEHRAWGVISPGNLAPIRTLEKLGFHRERSVTLIRLLGWQRVRAETGGNLGNATSSTSTEYPETRRHQMSRWRV